MAIRTKKLVRALIRRSAPLLGQERAHALERRHRGRDDHRRLRACDFAVVSRGKSGRTWLRTMLSRYYALAYGLPGDSFLDFDNLHGMNSRIPRVFFTHDNNLRDYRGARASRSDYRDKKLVLMVRLPQDVAVSQFFQWKHRMASHKKALYGYPEHGADLSLFEFVMAPGFGLPGILEFMNEWALELDAIRSHLVVRYEDLRAAPAQGLERVVAFLGEPVDATRIADAVAYASADNMRAMERSGRIQDSGARLTADDRENPDAYKVRRGVVAGYRDYFDAGQIERIDALVPAKLAPRFGYTTGSGRPPW